MYLLLSWSSTSLGGSSFLQSPGTLPSEGGRRLSSLCSDCSSTWSLPLLVRRTGVRRVLGKMHSLCALMQLAHGWRWSQRTLRRLHSVQLREWNCICGGPWGLGRSRRLCGWPGRNSVSVSMVCCISSAFIPRRTGTRTTEVVVSIVDSREEGDAQTPRGIGRRPTEAAAPGPPGAITTRVKARKSSARHRVRDGVS